MAKAVRIRIKSGGETHNSLESLLRNFWIEDIIPLQDERLARWLEQKDSEATKEIKELRKKTREELYDYSTALEFCRQFFLFSKDKKIADFVKNIEISRENLTKFISILLETDGYEKSAYGIWAYTLCPLSPKSFKKLAKQAPQDVFSHLQDFSRKGTKHQFVWKWLGICYKKGIGTPKNLDEAKACFEKVGADAWVERQLEEIEKALSPQKKYPDVFRKIEEFDITLLRNNVGPSAPSILFSSIQKIYDACGTIDFPEIDKALRDLAKDVSDSEFIFIKNYSTVRSFIRKRFEGIAAEVAIKESSNAKARNARLRCIFPENRIYTYEARLLAYAAWWYLYEKKELEYAIRLAGRAYEQSPSITQEVIRTLENKGLDTTPFPKPTPIPPAPVPPPCPAPVPPPRPAPVPPPCPAPVPPPCPAPVPPPRPAPVPPPCPTTSFSEKDKDTSENQHAKDNLVKGFFNANIYNK